MENVLEGYASETWSKRYESSFLGRTVVLGSSMCLRGLGSSENLK